MLFNSYEFALFFPVVTALYFLTPARARWALLVAASCVFYMVFIPKYILILFALILIDYCAGLAIERSRRRRKIYLVLSLVSNLGILFIFKYFDFFTTNVSWLAQQLGLNFTLPTFSLLLPIGLSFHTFQSMAYTIEVYRGRQKAEKHLGIYALYVLFYPQLVAGPIERPQHMLHQFREKKVFSYERVTSGLSLMLVGLFKKMVIADRLAVIVNHVFAAPRTHTGVVLILATYAFTFEIFCDFSGYSDIARGAARVMGYDLVLNFNRPYSSTSPSEFWRRWHISLSSWFRDYVYIPLGGNRGTTFKLWRNLLIVFVLSGLWHGAKWTFVVWGLLHAAYLVLAQVLGPRMTRALRAWGIGQSAGLTVIRVLITFHLVALAWIFFRAETIGDAWFVMSHLTTWDWPIRFSTMDLGVNWNDLLIAIALVVGLEVAQFTDSRKPLPRILAASPVAVRWCAQYALIAAILYLGKFGNLQFIYFQF